MIKKTVTYTDYNGVERTEDFYFNLTKAEISEMEFSTPGGLTEHLKLMVSTQDAPTLIKLVKEFILKSYGIKSADGKAFMKSEQIRQEFEWNPAYSIIYMEFSVDANYATNFVNGVVPSDLSRKDPAEALVEVLAKQ